MSKEHYISLQHSESVVAQMAATVFAAYVQNNEVAPGNEETYVKKAVDVAVQLALQADKAVKSDEEFMPQESKSSVVL